MKKIHLESDIVLQSEQGSIKILTKTEGLSVHFEDWNTVSTFLSSAKGSFSHLKRLIGLTKNLEQRISIGVAEKSALTIYNGRIDQWKFGPSLKLFVSWLRSV